MIYNLHYKNNYPKNPVYVVKIQLVHDSVSCWEYLIDWKQGSNNWNYGKIVQSIQQKYSRRSYVKRKIEFLMFIHC